jgi:hypothetical protein
MADFPDLRSYVASLDANFARLAKMGNPQKDDSKRFFLLKGLNADYERNCLSTILSYESREGLQGANYDKAVKILTDWADGHRITAKPRSDTAMYIRERQTTTKPGYARNNEPCRRFSKGNCKLGTKCRYLHIDAPGRTSQAPPAQRKNFGNLKPKTKAFSGQCFACGKHGHRKKDCASFRKNQDSSHTVQEQIVAWPTSRSEDQAWVAHSNFENQDSFMAPRNVNPSTTLPMEQGMAQPIVWLIDGGTTCHVLCSFSEHTSYIYNRRRVDIDIVGVGGRVKCRDIGDMHSCYY